MKLFSFQVIQIRQISHFHLQLVMLIIFRLLVIIMFILSKPVLLGFKQSKLLKRELKNMQGKDWVMECARLEGMLQEAFKIVQHAEAHGSALFATMTDMASARFATMELEEADDDKRRAAALADAAATSEGAPHLHAATTP